jgi:hypothetical protein
MYDQDTFRWAKRDLVWAALSRRTHDNARNAEFDFIEFLLEGAIIHGKITKDDVECSIRYSGVLDYVSITDRERTETVERMWQQGERYIGVLSREQREELKLLHELCDRLTHDGDLSVLQQIVDLIR